MGKPAKHQKWPNSLQKMKCCMMGNLDRTSTWYILIMPLFTCARRARSQPVRHASAPPQQPLAGGAF